MIVAPLAGRLRIVTQNDHAHFAGALLSLWVGEGLPRHPRRDDLLFAARHHDDGWWETDAAPHVDPGSGRPYDFASLPAAERRVLWERGVRRHVDRPYAALLIVTHALALHQGHGEAGWEALLAGWRELRDELLQESPVGPATLAADYRWIDLSDYLSLVATNGWQKPFSHRGVSGLLDGATLRLAPFPLAGATTFRIPCRFIPDRRYAGAADLGGELASARWEEAVVQVAEAAP